MILHSLQISLLEDKIHIFKPLCNVLETQIISGYYITIIII